MNTHEAKQKAAEHPWVATLSRRFAPQLKFVVKRLSPGGYLGLHLTIGVVLLIGASWLFGGIAQDVMVGDPLTIIDQNVAEWFHEHRTPGLTTLMQLVSGLASLTRSRGVDVKPDKTVGSSSMTWAINNRSSPTKALNLQPVAPCHAPSTY